MSKDSHVVTQSVITRLCEWCDGTVIREINEMMTLILGGSGSGKSVYAEDYLLRAVADKQKLDKRECRKYYIATMQIWDAEMQAKVDRHHRLRQGKGFTTIEQPVALEKALEMMRESENAEQSGNIERFTVNETMQYGNTERPEPQIQSVAALLECMSNLVANEMYSMECNSMDTQEAGLTVTERVLQGVEALKRQADLFVIVTNNVFEDGITYDSSTMEYIETLGRINERMAAEADEVIEVVAGIPQWIKKADIQKSDEENRKNII